MFWGHTLGRQYSSSITLLRFLLTSTSASLGAYLLLPLSLPARMTQTPSSLRALSLWSPGPSQSDCCTWLTIFHLNWTRDYQETLQCITWMPRVSLLLPLRDGSPTSPNFLSTKERTWWWLFMSTGLIAQRTQSDWVIAVAYSWMGLLLYPLTEDFSLWKPGSLDPLSLKLWD